MYPNGTCIQTTCVHPSWHATGIVEPYKDRLAQAGVQFGAASDVSEAVIEQVLAARSGQVFVPRSAAATTRYRDLPIWVRDAALYLAAKRNKLVF